MIPLSWSQKILFGLIKCSYTFCNLVGFVPFSIDFNTLEITEPKWKIFYCVVLNVTMILFYPLMVKATKSGNLASYSKKKPLIRIIAYVNLSIRTATFLFTIYTNWKRRKLIKEMIQELLRIFKEVAPEDFKKIPKKYISAIIVKYVLLVLQTLTWFSAIMNLNGSIKFNMGFLLISFYIPFMFLILSVIVNNFWIFSLVVCIRYRLDNQKLIEIIKQKRSTDRNLCERIFQNHFKMERVLKMIKEIYEFPFLSALLGVMLMNITIWHYGLTMVIGNLFPKNFFTISTGLAAVITFILEFYLMIFVCDESQAQASKSRKLLKKVPHLYGNEGIDFLSSSLCLELEKYDDNLGGLLVINKSSGFEMMAATFMHTIFLVQFDFNNLGL